MQAEKDPHPSTLREIQLAMGSETQESAAEIKLRSIGVVQTKASDDQIKVRAPNIESIIKVFPEYREALDGLDGYSHIFVIAYFHKLRPEQIGQLKVRPRGLLRYGFKLEDLPLKGVLSLDSPTRPNPIGLSLVPLLKIEEQRNVVVSNLDLFDGTPVLDLKPYQASYRAETFSVPDWHANLLSKAGHV
jgi:tRNA (adenine37-N6)-methyltransferase